MQGLIIPKAQEARAFLLKLLKSPKMTEKWTFNSNLCTFFNGEILTVLLILQFHWSVICTVIIRNKFTRNKASSGYTAYNTTIFQWKIKKKYIESIKVIYNTVFYYSRSSLKRIIRPEKIWTWQLTFLKNYL